MNSLDKSANSSISSALFGKASPTPSRDAEITRLTEINRTQEIKIQALIQEVAYLRRMRYGVKNEAMSAEQRSLFEDDVIQDLAAVESELELPAAPALPRSRAGRQTLPEHLERVDVRHEPDSCNQSDSLQTKRPSSNGGAFCFSVRLSSKLAGDDIGKPTFHHDH